MVLPDDQEIVKKNPRFKIRILSPARCELWDENNGCCEAFTSLKAAMDFVGMMENAHVTMEEDDGTRRMRLVLPKSTAFHREAME